jgi:hypothetical protein
VWTARGAALAWCGVTRTVWMAGRDALDQQSFFFFLSETNLERFEMRVSGGCMRVSV